MKNVNIVRKSKTKKYRTGRRQHTNTFHPKKMPFLGRDWRSQGDEWVKTKEGWEKLKLWRVKVFENLNSHCLSRLLRLALDEWDDEYRDLQNAHQPYIRYIRSTSREQKVLTSISESFIHLDMATAGKDLRRFNYVVKLLKLLLVDKLPLLSGSAQKYVFNILEELVNYALNTGNNVAEMRRLLNFAVRTLHQHHYYHIGSAGLWSGHHHTVNRLATKLRRYNIKERHEDGKVSILDLPPDCVRTILSTIPDHADILHLGETNSTLNHLSNEGLLWREMCLHHFTSRQLLTFVNQNQDESQTDWKYVYKRCFLRYGKKETYADMLAICCNCNTIFWQSIGHPCSFDKPAKHKVLKPEEFLALFQC